jgi:cytochrome c
LLCHVEKLGAEWLLRRDQQLCSAPEHMLDMHGNRVLYHQACVPYSFVLLTIVEQERLRRRGQQLCPAPEDMLDMQGERVLYHQVCVFCHADKLGAQAAAAVGAAAVPGT